MPPDPVRQADEFSDPLELALLEALLVVGLPGLRIGEDPICIAGILAEGPPFKQQSFETQIERNIVLGIFRLHRINPSADKAALNHEGVRFKVEVAPLRAKDFADAKSRTLCHHDHRAVRLREMLEHLEELSHFEDLGSLQPLACVLDAHQSDGVLADLNYSPSFSKGSHPKPDAPGQEVRVASVERSTDKQDEVDGNGTVAARSAACTQVTFGNTSGPAGTPLGRVSLW
jgi:hypothetical protein